MRGGSLTQFRTDEWYDQSGKGLVTDLMRGGLQGLKSTRNPFKLPSHTVSGLKAGLSRGVKRKAEDVIKKEITKQAKKAWNNKNVKEAVRVASALFPRKPNERGIFLVCKTNMEPVPSRPRRIRSDRGFPQRGGLFPFWKLLRRQRGEWLSPSVMKSPGFDLAQLLTQRYKNPSRRRGSITQRRRRRRR